jgi:hypothetical protein
MTGPVTLPARRGVKIDKPRLIDFGGPLKPPLGGAVQTILRLGTRHAIDITIPLMRSEPDGREWSAFLRMGKIYGVRARYRQDGLGVGSPGAPLVDGAGQYGTTIALKGFTPGYAIRLGQAVSLVVGGRNYLYFAAAGAVAGSDGRMPLSIFPMLRKSPADGDTVEVARPLIEGSLAGNEVAWTRLTAPFCDFGTITISEDE